eukprot:TRINITY_DN4689_c0_g1_i1.p1 TRINITY_DN4689_c0_g1~~TRINITY_DN4689_c0_g1_i1.p1  ORF type:complete len:283 (-),score=40.34 TRINITY_DN4689_c0_g1_i1:215-1063(-)
MNMELQKINAIYQVNAEIILRIDMQLNPFMCNRKIVQGYSYVLNFSQQLPGNHDWEAISTCTFGSPVVSNPTPAATLVFGGFGAEIPAAPAYRFEAAFSSGRLFGRPVPVAATSAPAASTTWGAAPAWAAPTAAESTKASPPRLVFVAEARTCTGQQVVRDHQISDKHQLTDIEDMFNDKVFYKCVTFADIKRLNSDMHRVAQKYRLFGGSEESIAVLRQFLGNFEVLQVMLGEIENQLISVPNRVDELNARLAAANVNLSEVYSGLYIADQAVTHGARRSS